MSDTFLHGVEIVEVDYGPRPIRTLGSSVIGVIGTAPRADSAFFPFNTPVLVTSSRNEAARLGNDGTLPAAIDGIFDQTNTMLVVIRIEEGATEMQTLTNVVGGMNSSTDAYLGVQAFLAAKSVLGVSPRILIAPGFTHQRPSDPEDSQRQLANPVIAELIGIAERLRAVIVADGPSTNDADAIAYRGDWGSHRVYIVDPAVKVMGGNQIVTEAASARVAGLIAKIDNERGFWWSPSNNVINGVLGTERAVDFTLGDVNSRANLLNGHEISTIVNENGYRLWGNRTCSIDPKWAFLSVVRTADMIHDSLLRAHLWAVDRNITKTYVTDVVEGVNAYLRSLQALGAILGGKCWADETLNTPSNIQDGKVYFDFDFTPPYPAERISFRSHMVNNYIVTLISEAI